MSKTLKPINTVSADRILREYTFIGFTERQKQTITRRIRSVNMLNIISNVICEKFDVSLQYIQTPKRTKDIVMPRSIIWYVAHNMYNIPLEHIADFFGKKHPSVIKGIGRVWEKRQDPMYNECISLFEH